MFVFFANRIIAIIVSICIQLSAIAGVSMTPQECADDFFSGFKTTEEEMMQKHMQNEYINYMSNISTDEVLLERMNKALLTNFSYEILEIGEKNDVAVAKVKVTNTDFSGVMSAYEKVSYDYIMANLYKDEVIDKALLNEKCFDLYITEIENKTKEVKVENIVYLPMIDNGNYSWNIKLTDDVMSKCLGGIVFP